MKDKKIGMSFLHEYYENEALEESREEKMYRSDKHEAYWQNIRLNEIRKIFGQIKAEKFLDVGCADGIYIRIFNSLYKNTYTLGLDIANNYLKKIRINNGDNNISLIQGDANNLPFKKDYFDIVLCSETLEHVIDPEKSFYELYRVSNRYIIVSVPGHTPFFYIGKYLGIIKKQDVPDIFSSPGKGHINELDVKCIKKYLLEKNVKYNIIRQITYCYFPPILTKKYHIPLEMVKFMDIIFSYIPFLNSFGLVQILVIEKL